MNLINHVAFFVLIELQRINNNKEDTAEEGEARVVDPNNERTSKPSFNV